MMNYVLNDTLSTDTKFFFPVAHISSSVGTSHEHFAIRE